MRPVCRLPQSRRTHIACEPMAYRQYMPGNGLPAEPPALGEVVRSMPVPRIPVAVWLASVPPA